MTHPKDLFTAPLEDRVAIAAEWLALLRDPANQPLQLTRKLVSRNKRAKHCRACAQGHLALIMVRHGYATHDRDEGTFTFNMGGFGFPAERVLPNYVAKFIGMSEQTLLWLARLNDVNRLPLAEIATYVRFTAKGFPVTATPAAA